MPKNNKYTHNEGMFYMDLIDKIRALSAQGQKQIDCIQSEEATKTALVMPMLPAPKPGED